jgi:hypothetical protein
MRNELENRLPDRTMVTATKGAESTMSKNKAVFGIYATRSSVESAVTSLDNAGFHVKDVSILLPENHGKRDLVNERNTKSPEGTAAGAVSGAVLGGALGWLGAVGAIAIPGVGPMIAAGPIMAALAGVGAGGAVGGFTGALVGLGIPEYEAKLYDGHVRNGGILLSVHCDNPEAAARAKKILKTTGAEDISSTSEFAAQYAESGRTQQQQPMR